MILLTLFTKILLIIFLVCVVGGVIILLVPFSGGIKLTTDQMTIRYSIIVSIIHENVVTIFINTSDTPTIKIFNTFLFSPNITPKKSSSTTQQTEEPQGAGPANQVTPDETYTVHGESSQYHSEYEKNPFGDEQGDEPLSGPSQHERTDDSVDAFDDAGADVSDDSDTDEKENGDSSYSVYPDSTPDDRCEKNGHFFHTNHSDDFTQVPDDDLSDENNNREELKNSWTERLATVKIKYKNHPLYFFICQRKKAGRYLRWLGRIFRSLFHCIGIHRLHTRFVLGGVDPAFEGVMFAVVSAAHHAIPSRKSDKIRCTFEPVFCDELIIKSDFDFRLQSALIRFIMPLVVALFTFPYLTTAHIGIRYWLWHRKKRKSMKSSEPTIYS